jgi:hypothetical protein
MAFPLPAAVKPRKKSRAVPLAAAIKPRKKAWLSLLRQPSNLEKSMAVPLAAAIKPRKKAWLFHLRQLSNLEKSMAVPLVAVIARRAERDCYTYGSQHTWRRTMLSSFVADKTTHLKSMNVPFAAANTPGKEHGYLICSRQDNTHV